MLAPRIADRADHSGYAALSESAGDQYGVQVSQADLPVGIVYQLFRLDPFDLHSEAVCDAAMDKGFVETLIRVFQLYVFAYDSDCDRAVGILDGVYQVR